MAAVPPGAPRGGLLGLPGFMLSIFIFYWSLPIAAMLYVIKFLNLRGPRHDTYNWSCFMKKFFLIDVRKFGTNVLYKGGNMLYLCNHRSWTDFFLDVYLTEGNAALMSRWLVFFVFPIFMTSVVILKGVVLFKRGTIRDKEKFNKWLDEMLASSPVPGLLVYPEGHRSMADTSLPLKRGMLHYAYSRKMPVQIVITRNKELVIAEKTRTAQWGVTTAAGYSEAIHSKDFDNFEDFFKKLQSSWDELWKGVYSADVSKLPAFEEGKPEGFDYSMRMRLQQAAATTCSIIILLASLYSSYYFLMAALALLGPLGQQIVSGLLIVWLSTSMGYSMSRVFNKNA